MNKRDLFFNSTLVQGVTGREVINTVKDDIGIANHFIDIVVRHFIGEGCEVDCRVEAGEELDCGCGLVDPDVFFHMQKLPVQVAQLYPVGIADRDTADSGAGQIEGNRAAETAGTEDEDLAVPEFLLCLYSPAVNQYLPSVTLLVYLFFLCLQHVPSSVANGQGIPTGCNVPRWCSLSLT